MMLPNALRNSAVSAMTLDKPDKSHKLQQPNSAHTLPFPVEMVYVGDESVMKFLTFQRLARKLF
jgi:hypothetical protein